MSFNSLVRICLFGAALVGSCAASAELPQPVLKPDPNNLTVGLGVAMAPTYEGSDDYALTQAVLVRGQVAGFSFFSRGTALYLDLAREQPNAPIDLLIGPMANLRFDRSMAIKDRPVRRLGKLDTAIEAGAFVGIGRSGLLNPYDYAMVRFDLVKDVSGTHRGFIMTPNLEYGTPLSRKTYIGANLSADYVDGDFARTYYTVDAPGRVRSGLRRFDARSGFKNARLTLLGTQRVTGDLTSKGLGVFLVGSYSRMLGSFADSPLVRDAGSRNQYFAAAGLTYSF